MRTSRVLKALMLGTFTGTLIAGVAAADTAKVAGQVIAVTGPVTVKRADMPSHPLKFRDALYWRDVVEARKDGIARALLLGKATVTVRELSRLELREERQVDGTRYVAELISGKVRASVARMLMRPGEQVEVWTWNAVASVRGTDFIVETVERPAPGAFGLLGEREVAQGVADRGKRTGETVVVTLSGVVEVSNRLAGTGQFERIGAYEAVSLSGNRNPVRFQVSSDEVKVLLRGLTPPRPEQARSGDKAEAVGKSVESAALTTSAQSARALGQAGGDRGRQGSLQGGKQDGQSGAQGNGNGFAIGQGNGIGLAVGHANLANDIANDKGKDKGKKK